MFCRRCRYSLNELPAGPCPECGSVFDPADPRTFDNGPRPVRTSTKLLLAPALVWPVLTTLWLHVMWLVACLRLGRWPSTGGMDKPPSIPIVRELLPVQYLLLLAFPLALGAILMLANRMAISVSTGRQKGMGCLALAVCWGAAAAVLFWDPVGAWSWFWD